MYSERALKEFRHPKNIGEIKNPDGLGKVGNAQCGDLLWTYIKVGKNKAGKEIITDIKVKTFGCVAAIATSSILTKIAKGITIEEALKINKEKIAKELDGLPPNKMHCSVLAMDGLKRAIEDYRNKKAK
ncbi:MAG: iron-sulfur cluster assembly scaffold protein [Candidatus Diapherotrites archaeon]|uniref:Iron-sulfur cluster assembly scaffold protein n=1 Tax=Candidatus Iainarchaeum sp. TaxID=3101447 RepID=A0A8T4L3T2_9ARCH|nr:iron-sulfur cluster assembly scaffold protein [Candidatus Diapherotrites archaeon]